MPIEPLVAVIDDDELLRASLVRVLRSSGYGARGFASVEEFVAANGEVSCHCVITDIHMPRMSGFDLKRLLVDRGSQMPVIMITGGADADLESRAAASGAVCLLRKPFQTQALLSSLGEALRSVGFNEFPTGRWAGQSEASPLAAGWGQTAARGC